MFVLKKAYRIFSLLTAFVITAVALTGCSSTSATGTEQITINLAAGVGLIDVMNEIGELYTEMNPHVTITPTFAAAGVLQEQIRNGAPVDILIVPSKLHMDNLDADQLLLDGSRKELLHNKLVLIVPDDDTLGLTGFEDLTGEKVSRIAIGDPDFVPVGEYVLQAFDLLGIMEQVEPKLILCADVRQVLTYVESGNVDAGIVYMTDAITSDKVTVIDVAPDEINAKIIFWVAIITDCKNPDAVGEFEDFLFSDDSKDVFEKYGFTPIEN